MSYSVILEGMFVHRLHGKTQPVIEPVVETKTSIYGSGPDIIYPGVTPTELDKRVELGAGPEVIFNCTVNSIVWNIIYRSISEILDSVQGTANTNGESVSYVTGESEVRDGRQDVPVVINIEVLIKQSPCFIGRQERSRIGVRWINIDCVHTNGKLPWIILILSLDIVKP